ncbi:uncharacterized protein LOC111601317 isoform X3 [Drosophila hydei]|uniref:Uncharacterized protein LOC111601317 isoform X3 n=1 Tax=Drosophila hydei TaxID=7224 RepID=A0A6J1M3I8_DROHY|nr:uncharacterized protein LOC111601317 isoform X3 [Drosophila hydei]
MVIKRNRYAEDLRRKALLKYKFKKVVREVIMNSQWLDENYEDQKISANVKKNIALMMRTKRRVGILTIYEKSLIRTPHHLRTISDRSKLCILFAGLRCFLCIPPKLRARVVPVIKYMSANPGRTIIRQGDEPHIIFFIVAGEIGMLKQSDRKSNCEISFGPGDCIGDIEIIEDRPRDYSYVATSQCELLVLVDNDFNSILKPYMQKVWNDKKAALKALDYFDFLSEDQILKACKLCTLKQYKPLDTIYSHDRGKLTNVHFVLSGQCLILQCLNMKNGKKGYELVDTLDGEFLNMNSNNSINKREVKSPSMFAALNAIHDNEKESFGLLKILAGCEYDKKTSKSALTSLQYHARSSSIKYFEYCDEDMVPIDETHSSSVEIFENKLQKISSNSHNNVTETDNSEIFSVSSSSSSSSRKSPSADLIENHFIDVGSLTFGGIFGLGENMLHRVIMARSTVQCLLLPRFFLFDNEQNPGNIWQRRLFYLDCIIPSRESLFDNFLKTLKWNKFKIDLIKNLTLNTKDIAKFDDIPILCRIEEDSETQ